MPMRATETTIKQALASVVPRTPGVIIGCEVVVGLDSTDDEAVWVWVAVPDRRLVQFTEEWPAIRDEIRQCVRQHVGNPELYVYLRMLAASTVRRRELANRRRGHASTRP